MVFPNWVRNISYPNGNPCSSIHKKQLGEGAGSKFMGSPLTGIIVIRKINCILIDIPQHLRSAHTGFGYTVVQVPSPSMQKLQSSYGRPLAYSDTTIAPSEPWLHK